MHFNYILPITIIIISFIFTVFFILIASKNITKKHNKYIHLLAETLNLSTYEEKFHFPHKPTLTIEGNYKGRALKISTAIINYHNRNRTYTVIRILGPNPLQLTLNIWPNRWTYWVHKIKKPKRITWNNLIDKQFIVKTNKPNIIKNILNDSFQKQLMSFNKTWKFVGHLEFKDNALTFTFPHRISSKHTCRRLEALIHLMYCLHNQIDIYSKEIWKH